MAEVMNRLLLRGSSMGLFQGLQVGRQGVTITHLQFAEDTLLFCEAKEESLQNIKGLLLGFQSFSGLAVNYSKSGLIVFGKDESWAIEMAEKLSCKLVHLPITYLGVPLGANMRKVRSWQGVLDKVQSRLQS